MSGGNEEAGGIEELCQENSNGNALELGAMPWNKGWSNDLGGARADITKFKDQVPPFRFGKRKKESKETRSYGREKISY
ncbi:hypothetical protein Tco_1243202 [Tanacetum coccineum]